MSLISNATTSTPRGTGSSSASGPARPRAADLRPPARARPTFQAEVEAQPSSTSRAPEQPAEQPAAIGEPLAEAAVLGCLLRTTAEHATALLAAFVDEDLTVPQYRHVAVAARSLLEQGHPIDPVTVLGQLRRQGTENARTANRDAGVLLVELCQAAPSVGSAGHYLRIVLEHAYRRRVQAAAVRLLQVAETSDLADLSHLIDAEHLAVIRARHRCAAPGLLRTLPAI